MEARRPLVWLWLALPALLFLALHLRALHYELVWADDGEIRQGSLVRPPGEILAALGEPLHGNLDYRLAGRPQPYYRPMQVMLVSALHARVGPEPSAYRTVSLVLGALTAALVAAVAWAVSGRAESACLAGCVFAAHPVGLEAYVWVGGLSAALMAFFTAASLLAAWGALREDAGRAQRVGLGALSLAALLLGLLSKENAVVTPALLAALVAGRIAAPRRGHPARGRDRIGPALALVGAQGVLAAVFTFVWRPHVLGGVLTGAPPIGGSALTQVSSALALWPRALAWLLAPIESNTSDAIRIVESPLDPRALQGAALLVGSLAAWLWLARRGHGVAALGLAWIWIAYLPTSSLVPLLHAHAERNLFLASFGVALLWQGGALALARFGRAPPWLTAALAVALVAGLSQRTWARTPDWRSTIHLFESDVARDPLHREGRYNLAVALADAGRLREAKEQLDELLALRSTFGREWSSYLREPDALEVSCIVNRELGRPAETLAFFEGELAGNVRLTAAMPGYMYCVGTALEEVGRPGEALGIYERLRERYGDEPLFLVATARAHARAGRPAEARQWLRRAAAAGDPRIAADVQAVRKMLRGGGRRRF